MAKNFLITLRTPKFAWPLFESVPFESVEAAYLDVCAAIPDAAADLLRERINPFHCVFLISDESGALLMEVPLSELLPRTSEAARQAERPLANGLVQRVRAEGERLRLLRVESRRQLDRAASAKRNSLLLMERLRGCPR